MAREELHTGRRPLARDHFAFYRSCVEGLHPKAVWERYLAHEGDFSEELARSYMGWIRTELLLLCEREEPKLLALLRRDPRKIKTLEVPPVEAIAEELGVDIEFFTHAEFVAEWVALHRPPRPPRKNPNRKERTPEERRIALAKRLRSALLDLEGKYSKTPAAGDQVRQWLAQGLSEKLAAAGIATLGALVALRRSGGQRWWDAIDGLGEVGGRRLQGWLDKTFPPPAAPLRVEPAAAARPTPATLIPAPALPSPPVEALEPPAPGRALATLEVDVPAASAPAAALPAVVSTALLRQLVAPTLSDTESQCITNWIEAKSSSPATARSYRREAERFVLWLRLVHGVSLDDLTTEHCASYRHWLGELGHLSNEQFNAKWQAIAARGGRPGYGVASAWLGPKSKRDQTSWRPFAAALSGTAQVHAMTLLRAFCEFRARKRLAPGNPWDEVRLKPVQDELGQRVTAQGPGQQSSGFTGRALSVEQARYALSQAHALPGPAGKRAVVCLWLGLGCGLRASEMCGLSIQNFGRVNGEWQIHVEGKGGKARDLVVPSPAMEAIFDYMASCNVDRSNFVLLADSRGAKDSAGAVITTPLLRSHSPRTKGQFEPRLGYNGLRAQLEGLLEACANNLALDAETSGDAARFRAATVHWLRHTFGTQTYKQTQDIRHLQDLMGHADINTTMGYVDLEAEKGQAVADAMAGLFSERSAG